MKVIKTTVGGHLSQSVLSVKSILPMLLGIFLMATTNNASALEIEEWRFRTSLYTYHWDPQPEHVSNSKLINLEFQTASKWIYGFAWFDNSFGQPSQYLYAGYSWDMFGTEWAYVSLTGGLLHGYEEPYQDKIPLNGLGVAPAIVPTIGVRYKRVFGEIQILGLAAVTATVGFSFGRKSQSE